MLPQIKAAIALGVIIPVAVVAVLLIYIWLLRRRLRQEKSCDEETISPSFRVNCVHKLVKVEDIEAKAQPTPSVAETTTRSTHHSIVEADSDSSPVQSPVNNTPHWTCYPESDLPRYSDKQVAPDPTLPEVVSGPYNHGRVPSQVPAITTEVLPEEETKSIKQKQRLTVDEIIGIDKRSLLQDLPAYQPGRPPCLHVATANLGQPNSFVSPWDVEFKPNPFIFSHLSTPGGTLDPTTPVSAISANSPTSPISYQPEGPFELDAVETEFNPWLHPPRTLIQGVPHRWEQTLGIKRMFFEAEHDRFPNAKRRNFSEHNTTLESVQPKRKGQRVDIESRSLSSSTSRSQIINDLLLCTPGPSSQSPRFQTSTIANTLSNRSQVARGEPELVSVHLASRFSADNQYSSVLSTSLDDTPETQDFMTFVEQEQQWQATTGKGPQVEPTAWDHMDVSFVAQLAASHQQQLKFFDKFCKLPVTPVSPGTMMSRRDISFSGCSSPATTPTRSSLRSFGSLLTPVTPQSPSRSSTLSISHSCQSATSFASASSATTVSVDNMKFPCSDCHLKFRTPGLRKNHFNRKHNLRYTCVLCPAAFGLRKDLQRHEGTVHKELFTSNVRLFCPNPGCATPSKEFNRKDNFNRHVERCRQAVDTRGTAR